MTTARSQVEPLFRRARRQLLELIAEGGYQEGDRLPSETALAHQLGVHRLTLRRATTDLAREGLLVPRAGSGLYLAKRPVVIPVNLSLDRDQIYGRLARVLDAAGTPWREVLLSSALDDDPRIRQDLDVPRAAIRRVESALEVQDERWVLSTWWLPDRLVPNLENHWDDRGGGLYALVMDRLGIPSLKLAWRSFDAEVASVESAAALAVAPGAPLLVRDGLTLSLDGAPVVRTRRRSRVDRLRYVMDYQSGSDG